MANQVLIIVDTSDLERVAEWIRGAAAYVPRIASEGLAVCAAVRKTALVSVTPRSSDRDAGKYPSKSERSPGHLQDSYYVNIGTTDAVVGTTDADKWNIVNTEQGAHFMRPIHKKALSWPGMTGPRIPWVGWKVGEGYDVRPVFRVEKGHGFMHPGHASLDLENKAANIYGPMDGVIMQAIADDIMSAVVYGPAGVSHKTTRQMQAAMQPRDVRGRFVKMV